MLQIRYQADQRRRPGPVLGPHARIAATPEVQGQRGLSEDHATTARQGPSSHTLPLRRDSRSWGSISRRGGTAAIIILLTEAAGPTPKGSLFETATFALGRVMKKKHDPTGS